MAEELAALEDVVIGMIQSVIHLTNNTTVVEELVVPEDVALKETRIVINNTTAEELVVPEAVAL
jgi:hypothetical protein